MDIKDDWLLKFVVEILLVTAKVTDDREKSNASVKAALAALLDLSDLLVWGIHSWL